MGCCGEYLMMVVALQTILRYSDKWQGALGEQIANQLAIERLGMSSVGFTAVNHGLDGVFRDSKGNTVVVEAKCTTGNPFSTLSETNNGLQTSNQWIAANAGLMQREASAQCAGKNSQIGTQIQRALDDGSLRCLLVHSNPETQEVRAYERISEANVRSASSWQLVASWKEK